MEGKLKEIFIYLVPNWWVGVKTLAKCQVLLACPPDNADISTGTDPDPDVMILSPEAADAEKAARLQMLNRGCR